MRITESVCCTCETSSVLLINYGPINLKKEYSGMAMNVEWWTSDALDLGREVFTGWEKEKEFPCFSYHSGSQLGTILPFQQTFGCVWRCFWLSQLGVGVLGIRDEVEMLLKYTGEFLSPP